MRRAHLFVLSATALATRARMRAAYRAAGPEAVKGFRTVLEAMMDPDQRRQYQGLKESGP